MRLNTCHGIREPRGCHERPPGGGRPRCAASAGDARPLDNSHLMLPWRASGNAFIFAGLAQPAPTQEGCPTPYPVSAPSALAVIDYHQSPVGPYREFAWQPGRVGSGQRFSHISHICVDSQQSVTHGRRLFHLDKKYADFSWTQELGGRHSISAAQPSNTLWRPQTPNVKCCARLLSPALFRLGHRVAQRLLPPLWQLSLGERADAEVAGRCRSVLTSKITFEGDIGLSWLEHLHSDGVLLPAHGNLSLFPLGLHVTNFHLTLTPSKATSGRL